MSAEENRTVVVKFYDCMARCAFDDMFDLMSEGATWTVAGQPETFRYAGTQTKHERAAALVPFMKVFASLNIELLSTTAEDDRVVIEARTSYLTHNGVTYDNEVLSLLRFEDGKIVSIYEHLDQQATLGFERTMTGA